jgi:ubiquinone biosynthesis protein UbiJ
MEKSKRITIATHKIIEIEPVIKRIESTIEKFDTVDQNHSQKLADLQKQIEAILLNKTDTGVFNSFKENVEAGIRDMLSNYQLQVDRTLNTENYIEKYLPLFFQR